MNFRSFGILLTDLHVDFLIFFSLKYVHQMSAEEERFGK